MGNSLAWAVPFMYFLLIDDHPLMVETAAILGISVNTASSHLRSVFEKLEASNRAHAVSLYIKAKSLASAFDVWPNY